MTAANTFNGQPATAHNAKTLYRFLGIFGASGIKTARRGKKRRHQFAIQSDNKCDNVLHFSKDLLHAVKYILIIVPEFFDVKNDFFTQEPLFIQAVRFAHQALHAIPPNGISDAPTDQKGDAGFFIIIHKCVKQFTRYFSPVFQNLLNISASPENQLTGKGKLFFNIHHSRLNVFCLWLAVGPEFGDRSLSASGNETRACFFVFGYGADMFFS